MKGGMFGALSLIAVLTAVPALATDPAPAAFKTVASQAYVDLTRQSTISATSDGTNNTPNYVYNQSTNPNAAGSVVTTTTTAGTVGERGIANAPVSNGSGGYTNGDWLPTVNAMMGAINTATNTLSWTSTETTAVGNYSTAFDGTTGNWPAADASKLIDGTGLATALSNKQNKITTGLVEFYDGGNDPSAAVNVRALVATDSTGTELNGNTIGIVDGFTTMQAPNSNDLPSNMIQYILGSEYDNFVPSLRALAITYSNLTDEINNIQTYPWTALELTSEMRSAISAYDTLNSWPTATNKLANAQFMKEVLAMKQNKLTRSFTGTNADPGSGYTYKPVYDGGEAVTFYQTATSAGSLSDDRNLRHRYVTADGAQPLTIKTGADNVILYVNGTKTLSEFQLSNFGNENSGTISIQNGFIKGALVSLELLRDTYADLDAKITANTLPTGTTGYVATYTSTTPGTTTGVVGGEVAIYSGPTAQTPYNATNDANKLATAGFVETKQDTIVTDTVEKMLLANEVELPALASYNFNGNDGLVANTVGILTDAINVSNRIEWDLALTDDWLESQSSLDDVVPTVKFLAREFRKMYWNGNIATQFTNAINEYSTTFNGTTNNWPDSTALGNSASEVLVTANVFAQGLALKQNKLPALLTGNAAPDGPALGGGMTIALTSTPGVVETRYIAAGGGNSINAGGNHSVLNYIDGSETLADYSTNSGLTANQIRQTLVSLETLKDTYAQISNDISDAIEESAPTGTVGYVATYLPHTNDDPSGEGKVGGEVAIYDTANAYNASTDASKLATAGFVATKQNQIGATTSTYVYDSTNNTTADGSVVTTNTLGVTGERGIATAPVYTTNNNVTTLTNSSWLPTMGAMMNQINTATATLTWTSTEATAASNYSTSFAGTTGNWPAADADKKVDGTALAAALATKQNKMVCTGWSSDTHTDANCWIWSIE